MAIPFSEPPQPLAEIAAYLFARREAILTKWRLVCEQDPSLSKVMALSREEFNNLLPLILISLDDRLLNKPSLVDPAITAQAHGLHRWQKSHALIDTLNELNHLTQVLNAEIRLFEQLFPHFDLTLLLSVQQQIGQLMQETVNGSVQKYDELQRLQAASRVDTLQQVVLQMQELSTERGDVLRTSTHDLKSSFSIINSAFYLLDTEGLGEVERKQYTEMLGRNLTNVRAMLTSLMDLSRLEAGQEKRHVESVDAAQVLMEIVDSAQPIATERGIVLWADGPPVLMVKTDRVKLQRIVQNLLLNALTYTPSIPEQAAMVSVSWSVEGEFRWGFSIQDSGPGLSNTTLGGVFGQQLRPTVEATSVLGPDQSEPVAVLPDDVPYIPTSGELNALGSPLFKGEGVGLLIVKRLCELLDANLDVETQTGRGTLFRVRMPVVLQPQT